MKTDYNPGNNYPSEQFAVVQDAHECPAPEPRLAGENVLRPSIMTKCCSICKLELPISSFYFKRTENVYVAKCKECTKTQQRQRNKDTKTAVSENKKRYWESNKATIKARRKTHKVDPVNKRDTHREWERKRLVSDPCYRLAKSLRRRARHAMVGKGGKTTEELLGCSFEAFKLHLESKFTTGMTWDNYGEWEIDHIFPLSKANLNDLDEVKRVCHFSNLQPLWKIDNIIKSNKL